VLPSRELPRDRDDVLVDVQGCPHRMMLAHHRIRSIPTLPGLPASTTRPLIVGGVAAQLCGLDRHNRGPGHHRRHRRRQRDVPQPCAARARLSESSNSVITVNPGLRWSRLLGAPMIGLLLVLSWLAPLSVWALAVLGGLSTALFVLIVSAHDLPMRRRFTAPVVVATLVMYAIVLFTLAYGSISLVEPGSVQTNGDHVPQLLGVAAMLATAMGIAGGEVGAHVQEGARIIAHAQLLLVIGAVAGVGGQIARRLADGSAHEAEAPVPTPPPRSMALELYARVYQRLSERGGDTALEEQLTQDTALRERLKQQIAKLPSPDVATKEDALRVFNRINSDDLEYFYTLSFEDSTLGRTVRAWLNR